jgi:hypothetical protein
MEMLLILASFMLSQLSHSGVFGVDKKPLNLKEHQGSDCLRTCAAETKAKVCYFNFTVEHYTAMGS